MACQIIILDQWSQEFEKFVFKLDRYTRAKLTREIDILEKRGPILPMPYAKKIKPSIWELRVRGNQEVRVLYSVKDSSAYFLNWFVKKSQKTPLNEIDKAVNRLQAI